MLIAIQFYLIKMFKILSLGCNTVPATTNDTSAYSCASFSCKFLPFFFNALFQLKICFRLVTVNSVFQSGMWKRLFFKRFRFRFHQQKTKKRLLTIFLNFCGFVACLLLHFIILRKQKPSFTAITLPTSLELIVSNYSVFVFLRYQNSC